MEESKEKRWKKVLIMHIFGRETMDRNLDERTKKEKILQKLKLKGFQVKKIKVFVVLIKLVVRLHMG